MQRAHPAFRADTYSSVPATHLRVSQCANDDEDERETNAASEKAIISNEARRSYGHLVRTLVTGMQILDTFDSPLRQAGICTVADENRA